MPESPSLAVFVDDAPQLTPAQLKELYSITGRSTVELRTAILNRHALYSAELFGNDHVDVAPRLEKAVAFCERHEFAFHIEETYDGITELINLDVMRNILEAAQDYR